MTHRVVLSPRARRDLEGVPPRIAAAVVAFVFGDLAENPRRVGKPLRLDLDGSFGARRGPYRVLYDVDDEAGVVLVLRIAHRADVYRRD